MSSIEVRPLQEGLTFGSRIWGVTYQVLADPSIRRQLNEIFEQRGLILFEDVEPSSKMHVAISDVFGPLKDHPVKTVPRVDQNAIPGVIDMTINPQKCTVVEIEGKRLSSWLPWHFDHCYNNELNRAGVLRALDIPPEGAMTGFADGIELHDAVSPELLERIGGRNIIYTLDLLYDHMRFGKPQSFKSIRATPGEYEILEIAKKTPRAIHPAIWHRPSGEKVLHVSPWMAVGIEGHEDPEGDQLLETLCQEMVSKIHPYFHQWKTSQMLIWDNWRMLHCVSGCDPKYPRRMQRTTIKGDYGLGYFEHAAEGHSILEMTV